MTTDISDSDISGSAQTHQYFLQESAELLQTMDDELQDIRQAFSIQKVHNLMRAAHTLKGASASVGLDAIKKTTHSLEDIFKALCHQDTVISVEMEGLIFQSYECLKLLMSAQLAGAQVDEADVLDRMAAIVTRVQSILGDRFGQGGHLPTSSELGFDMTQSIFEVGVAQRIEELEEALEDLDPEELLEILEIQGEVFVGLAESLDLPGFGHIATTTLAAIEKNPEQVLAIAPVALANYKTAQAAVLAGDREQGGKPSPALQAFCAEIESRTLAVSVGDRTELSNAKQPNIFHQVWTFLTRTIRQVTTRQKATVALQSEESGQHINQDEALSPPPSNNSDQSADSGVDIDIDRLNNISIIADDVEPDDVDLPDLSIFNIEPSLQPAEEPAEEPVEKPAEKAAQPATKTPQLTPKATAATQETNNSTASIRMTVKNLDQLSQSMGDLLTHHNRLALYNEQLTVLTKALMNRIIQQRNQLSRPIANPSIEQRSQEQLNQTASYSPETSLEMSLRGFSDTWLSKDSFAHFDALELDRYSDTQLLIQSFLEETAQQSESAEAIELFVTRSAQALAKQKQLLTSARKTLLSSRMLPLENILNRFFVTLERLQARHHKQVTLTLIGSDVLVDKVIVDKLYDPLLHLVRNAFDHGIESPDLRQQQHKPAMGNITIEARQRGRHLLIEVKDDGQGLDLEKIRQKAIDTQLITAAAAASLTPDQTIDLLFEAGFSTASEIDDLSGRGVGLDAVQAQIRALQGWVSVSHESGAGTCFSLQIPSSLTIGKLLLCQSQGRIYAIMTDAIEQILIPTAAQVRTWDNCKTLIWQADNQEHLVPLHALTDVLRYTTPICEEPPIATQRDTENSACSPVILLSYQNALVGIEIDQLLGEQELVINSLGKSIVPPAYLYGSSILPDGQLTLVLDGTMLAKITIEQRSQRNNQQKNKNNIGQAASSNSTNDGSANTNTEKTAATQQQSIRPQSKYAKSIEKLILTVDDSITVRNTLVDTLQKSGYKVIQARDGLEALQQLSRYPDVAVILCDIEMPRMNGFEFLKARQQDPAIAAIPTVMLTSREGAKHRLLTKELGATAYLTKPYLTPQLLEAIAEAIEHPTLIS